MSSGNAEPYKFNTKGVEVVYLPPNIMFLSQPLDQGFMRILKAYCTQYSLEMIVSAMEENPKRGNIMKVQEDYTIEDAIVVTEKALKAKKPKTINSCWRKFCPDVHDFTRFTTEPVKAVRKKIVDMAKKVRSEGFQDIDVGEIQELIDTETEELTEDDCLDRDECC